MLSREELEIPAPAPTAAPLPTSLGLAVRLRMVFHQQFVRYLLVGTWNTVFGYGLFALLTALLQPRMRYGYMLASALANCISITVAYLGYKFFVFKTQGNYLVEWLRCLLVYGTGTIPGLLLLPFFVAGIERLTPLRHGAPYAAGALALAITVVYSFFGHKHFSFRSRSTSPNGTTERTQA